MAPKVPISTLNQPSALQSNSTRLKKVEVWECLLRSPQSGRTLARVLRSAVACAEQALWAAARNATDHRSTRTLPTFLRLAGFADPLIAIMIPPSALDIQAQCRTERSHIPIIIQFWHVRYHTEMVTTKLYCWVVGITRQLVH